MPATNRETIRLLTKSILTRLENNKAITLSSARLRDVVRDELYDLVGPFIMTDQDLRDRTLEKIGASEEALSEEALAESAPYRTARSIVRKSFGDDELNGLFFQKPLKMIATAISEYLMRSSHIDDVFESDEDLQQMIVDIIRKFNPASMH